MKWNGPNKKYLILQVNKKAKLTGTGWDTALGKASGKTWEEGNKVPVVWVCNNEAERERGDMDMSL